MAKYLKPHYNPTSGKYNTTAPSKIKPYGEDIKRLLSEGKTFRQINIYIREKGYTGAESTIRMYATRERKLIREAGGTSSEKLERRWLIKLLYKPIDEIKKFSQEQLDKVIEQYPKLGDGMMLGKILRTPCFPKNRRNWKNGWKNVRYWI